MPTANTHTPSSTPAVRWHCVFDRTRPASPHRETRSRTARSPRPHTSCVTPDPAADTPVAAPAPAHSMSGSNATIGSARRSPSPASADKPPTTPESAARPHRPPTPPEPADTSAGHQRPTPPSPCSAKSPTPAQSPKSATAPTDATAGSPPSPPRSTLASSLAHSQGSPGSWSIFSCRAVVSIQLPSTKRFSVTISFRILTSL
jgi:hypothetical protein